MTDDIEDRLAQAAESIREYELLDRRCADLLDQKRELMAQLAALRAQLAEEEADVEWLEGRSFARLVASLRGTRDDDLARERAEPTSSATGSPRCRPGTKRCGGSTNEPGPGARG